MGETLGANSYGAITQVEARCNKRLKDGAFGATTTPTDDQVRDFMDEVSAILNIILAQEGFTVPVTDENIKMVLASWVADEVASIVEGINGSGRFGPRGKDQRGGMTGRYTLITKDAKQFVEDTVFGFEAYGAAREKDVGDVIAYNTANTPFFKRDGSFGD